MLAHFCFKPTANSVLPLTAAFLAGLVMLGPQSASSAKAEYWPVICRGPVMNMAIAPGRLTITAHAGMRAGRPRRGECVWLDRGMNRRGETRYGGRVIFRLPVDIRTVTMNRNGRIVHSITGHRDALRLWNANAAGRLFQFGARRVGRGIYEARLRPTAWPGSRRPGWPPLPGPGVYDRVDVRVIIDSIRVIRDGDRISPGDWFVRLAAGPVSRPATARSARWPRSGTMNVRDGRTYRPGTLRTVVRSLRPSERLRVAIVATDCDSDTLFEFGARLPGEVGDIFRALGDASGSGRCSGEEFGEMSGAPDVAGTVLTFRADALMSGPRTFVRRVRGDEVEFVVRGRIIPIMP